MPAGTRVVRDRSHTGANRVTLRPRDDRRCHQRGGATPPRRSATARVHRHGVVVRIAAHRRSRSRMSSVPHSTASRRRRWETASSRRNGVAASRRHSARSETGADTIVFWGVDPAARYPRFTSRYAPQPIGLYVPLGRAGRQVIAVDIGGDHGPADADARVELRARRRGSRTRARTCGGDRRARGRWRRRLARSARGSSRRSRAHRTLRHDRRRRRTGGSTGSATQRVALTLGRGTQRVDALCAQHAAGGRESVRRGRRHDVADRLPDGG